MGQEDGGRAAATNARLVIAAIVLGLYLLMALWGLLLDDDAVGTPLLIAGTAGAVASAGILLANLLGRDRSYPGPAPRLLTMACLLGLCFCGVTLLGLALFRIAIGDMTAALLSLGCIAPLLAATVPGVPTLIATRHG